MSHLSPLLLSGKHSSIIRLEERYQQTSAPAHDDLGKASVHNVVYRKDRNAPSPTTTRRLVQSKAGRSTSFVCMFTEMSLVIVAIIDRPSIPSSPVTRSSDPTILLPSSRHPAGGQSSPLLLRLAEDLIDIFVDPRRSCTQVGIREESVQSISGLSLGPVCQSCSNPLENPSELHLHTHQILLGEIPPQNRQHLFIRYLCVFIHAQLARSCTEVHVARKWVRTRCKAVARHARLLSHAHPT